MVIYADVLVLINFFVNYFLLLATKYIAHKATKRWRILLGALFGGLYALILYVPNIPKFGICILNLSASVLMLLIAFPVRGQKKFGRCFLTFFAVNFIFAGMMLVIWLYFAPHGMFYQNGCVYFDISLKTFLLTSCICYVLVRLLEKLLERKVPKHFIFDITLQNNGKSVATQGLLDTGNSLSDGFSDRPVLVAEQKTCEALLGQSIDALFCESALHRGETAVKLRLIPYADVSKGGVLKAVLIDSVSVPSKSFTLKNVLLAESLEDFKKEEYHVLLGNDFFEKES